MRKVCFFTAIAAVALVGLWATGYAHEDGVGDVSNGGSRIHEAHDPLPDWLLPPGGIQDTEHDFDVLVDDGDPETEEQGCIVCHDGPIWNHEETDQPDNGGYVSSDTTGTDDPQPAEISLKCLGCHDGTLPIDAFGGAAGTELLKIGSGDGAYLGTDLKHHHPVGIVYDDAPDASSHMVPRNGLNRYGSKPNELLVDGKVECVSCHNQHTHAQENNLENAVGRYSNVHEWGHFIRLDHLCFHCHERYQHDVVDRDVSPFAKSHHFPQRDDPWGLDRGNDEGAAIACAFCHDVEGAHPDYPGAPHNSPCVGCHATWDATPGTSPAAGSASSHHGFGAERFDPLAECAVCHADTETGQLTGAAFGIYDTPGCNSCHADMWSQPEFSVDAGGPYEDEAGDTTTLSASFVLPATPAEGDTLTAAWNMGDGTPPAFPTTITFTGGSWNGDLTTSHVFPVGTTEGIVTLANGSDDPVTDTFTVTVTDPAAPTADSWDVDPAAEEDFEITFEKAAGDTEGVFTAIKNGSSVAFGMEAAGTTFWFDMEFTIESWGVGSTYFANINRGNGTMNGIVITAGGGLDTFTAEKN